MERLLHREFMSRVRYSTWANERLYAAVTAALTDEYEEATPAEVHRLLEPLNALLVTGRLWLARIQGHDPAISAADEDLYDELAMLREAQDADDIALCDYVHGLAEEDLLRPIPYRDFDDQPHTNAQHELLNELLVQQSHARGRVCQLLTDLGKRSPQLDFLQFLRDTRKRQSA